MNRIIVSIFALVVFVACGGDTPEAVIANTQGRTPRHTLDTFASSPGTIFIEDSIDDVFESEAGDCGDVLQVSGYRTDSEVVFRFEVGYDFCFGTDLHQIALLDVTWKGDPGAIVFYNFGHPFDNPNGAAYFRAAGSGFDEVLPEILVTQWMDDPDDAYFYLSVSLDWFSFKSEEDTFSTFRVAAQVDRGKERVAVDVSDVVSVDFHDLP